MLHALKSIWDAGFAWLKRGVIWLQNWPTRCCFFGKALLLLNKQKRKWNLLKIRVEQEIRIAKWKTSLAFLIEKWLSLRSIPWNRYTGNSCKAENAKRKMWMKAKKNTSAWSWWKESGSADRVNYPTSPLALYKNLILKVWWLSQLWKVLWSLSFKGKALSRLAPRGDWRDLVPFMGFELQFIEGGRKAACLTQLVMLFLLQPVNKFRSQVSAARPYHSALAGT